MARGEASIKAPRYVMLVAICVMVAALYFARDFLIPLALAVMLSFLLAPLVTRLERYRLSRPIAVTIVVSIIFTILAALFWVVWVQVGQLAEDLPNYRDNIENKVRDIRGSTGGSKIGRAAETLSHVTDAATTAPTTQVTQMLAPETEPVQFGSSPKKPLFVSQVPQSTFGLGLVGDLLSPLGTFGIVIVFVIFMLIQREDMRDRVIRLVGEGQLHVTTQALDDAAERISKYLVAQSIVNGTYGLAISIGLCIIGFFFGHGWFPSFVLWGLLCAILRFIPYIGPWIAAAFPIALAFAVYPGYAVLGAVVAMFVIIELLSNNVMEPVLYGSSTGISTVAILVSAVFWTWLWGPVGLLLATPLTVCIVVIGKYVPQLAFLDILLGDQPVLELHQRFYQRLLASDPEEATSVAEELLQKESLEVVYDQMILPALAMAEADRHSGRLDEVRGMAMRGTLREIIEEVAEMEKVRQIRQGAEDTARAARDATVETPAATQTPTRTRLDKGCIINVVTLPAHDEADEIVGIMLTELLQLRGFCAFNISQTALASEMLDAVEKHDAHLVCVSALPPGAIAHSRYLCKRLTARYITLPLVLGLWTAKGDLAKAKNRVSCSSETPLTSTLMDAVTRIIEMAQSITLKQNSAKPKEPAAASLQ